MAVDPTPLLVLGAVLFATLGAYLIGLHVGRNNPYI